MPNPASPARQFQGFGPFASLLVTLAAGLLAGCLTVFAGIVAVLVYNAVGHHHADYSLTYRVFAPPAALATAFATGATLALLALRRRFRS